MRWDLVARVCEGGYLTPKEVITLWKSRNSLEEYIDSMLYNSNSILLNRSFKSDINTKHYRDGISVKALQILDEAFNLLDEESKQLWKWRFDYDINPAFIGQQLLNNWEASQIKNVKQRCIRKANECLYHIAEDIAENIVISVMNKKAVKTEARE